MSTQFFCHLLISSWLRALRKQNGYLCCIEAANSSLSLFFFSLHTEPCFSEKKYELLWPETTLGANVTRDCSSINSTWTGMQGATRFRDLTVLLRKAGETGIESSARGNGSWKGEEKKSVTGFSYFHYPLGPSDSWLFCSVYWPFLTWLSDWHQCLACALRELPGHIFTQKRCGHIFLEKRLIIILIRMVTLSV